MDYSQVKVKDLKEMKLDELNDLASFIRSKIITTVSQNGGHLSSNLGMVELTIALHKVFDTPRDKIIFDVSHQTYAHKLLTDRAEKFSTLRKMNGISGFSKYSESLHDAWEAGHSSTALSASIGMAVAREAGEDIGEIIAVVGDASITNGLSFEALNYLGANPQHKVIIVINDNEMSVSKNVGSIARTFNKIRVKRQKSLVYSLFPEKSHNIIARINGSIKSLIYHKNIFDVLNFKYFEGIDGHNIKQLVKFLEFAKNSNRSVVLHVKTTKGKGYKYAEEDKIGVWHHVPPFEIESGALKSSHINDLTGEVISKYLLTKYANDMSIRVITPAMSLGSGLNILKEEWNDRFYDVGIAEENAVVIASSMALCNMTPILFIYSTFLQRAYDEIIHDIARTNLPVLFCVDRAGIVDGDGDTHQGVYDVSFLKSIPGITITMPSCYGELKQLLDLGLAKKYGPFVIRYPKELTFAVDKKYGNIQYGTWEILLEPKKTTFITYGTSVYEFLEAFRAKELINDVGLINARFINPLDYDVLNMLFENNTRIVVYEEVIKNNSLGTAILEYANEKNIKIDLLHYALPNSYFQTATRKELLEKYNLNIETILEEVRGK